MKDPAFPLYVNNWLASARVSAMSLEQQGAFVRLLCQLWQSDDCTVADDAEVLGLWTGLGIRWIEVGAPIRRCLTLRKDGRLFSERLMQAWNERQAWRKKSARGGRNSGKARAKHLPSNHEAGGSIVEPPLNSESESESESEERGKPLSPQTPGGGVVSGWRRELFEALVGTSKFPELKVELVVDLVRGFPGADGWWREVVHAGGSLPAGVCSSPRAWLLRTLQGIEAMHENEKNKNAPPAARQGPALGPPAEAA